MAATRIDCDIHPAVGGTRTTLLPYLDDHWKEQVVSRAIDGLDLNSYPVNMPLSSAAPTGARRRASPAATSLCAARRVRPARRVACDLQCAVRRAGGVRPLYGGGLLQGDQRLDRGRMAVQGQPAARLDRNPAAGAGSGDRGNRAPRLRQPFCLRVFQRQNLTVLTASMPGFLWGYIGEK